MTPAEFTAEADRLRTQVDALLARVVDGCPAGKLVTVEVRNRLVVAATLLDNAATDAPQAGLYTQPTEPWDWQADLELLDQPIPA